MASTTEKVKKTDDEKEADHLAELKKISELPEENESQKKAKAAARCITKRITRG